jgi:hypothetical protein
MRVDPGVLARARARVRGAVALDAAEPAPPGMVLAQDGSRVWPLPAWPDGATPALLEEYETAPMPLDRPGQVRRVLAAALRCCWTEVDAAPWPGRTSAIADVLEVYAQMGRGDLEMARRWAVGELRRLGDSGWLLLDEPGGTLRLGPRTATWPDEGLASLRDLVRRLPEPPVRTGEPGGEAPGG